jgi:hypothetical protein
MHHRARRRSAASSSSGVAFTTHRSGTRDCACVTVMPQVRPRRAAASSTLARMRRWPCMSAVTSGLPRAGTSWLTRRNRSLGQRGRKSEMTRRIARLQNPGTRLTTSDAQQFDIPALALEFIDRPAGEGEGAIRQRVAAALGSVACSFSPAWRHRRIRRAVTPVSPAQSCRRREMLSERRVASPTTPASPLQRSPSSIAGSTSRSFQVSQ